MILRAHQGSAPQWRPPAPPARRRGLHGLGDDGATAVIVGARQGLPPGELYRQGMAGMGDATEILDRITGGKVTEIGAQVDRLEFWLQVAVVSSLFAGGAALVQMLRRKAHV